MPENNDPIPDSSQSPTQHGIPRVLWVVLTLATTLGLANLLVSRPDDLAAVLYGFVVASTGASLWLVRMGHPSRAILSFLGCSFLIISISVLLSGGVRSPSFSAYIALALLAGMLHGTKSAIAFGLLGCAVGLVSVLAPGASPTPVPEISAWRFLFAFLAQMSIGLLVFRSVDRSIAKSLATARTKAQDALEASRAAEQRAREQAAIAHLGELALRSRDLQHLFDECTQLVATTLDVEFAALLELMADGRSLVLRAGVGWQPGLVGQASVPNDLGSQAGVTLESELPVVVDDFERELRFSAPDLLRTHGVHSGASAAIVVEEKSFGILAAHSRDRGAFGESQAVFLRTAAGLLSTAIARSRLESRLARSGTFEAIGRLAGGIAHDFNNLLTIILGYAEILDQDSIGDLPPALAGKEIRDAAERAAALTRDLLTFARAEPHAPSRVDLNDVVSSSLRMLRRLVGEQVRLEEHLTSEPSPIWADASQVDRILVNLVLNARDALSPGGLIAVETSVRSEGDRECVRLSVRDNGAGMTPDVLARVFEPFFTTKADGRGSGLGLSTVHGLVRALGGEIRVTSTPGMGTLFDVDLPMASALPASEGDAPRVSAPVPAGRGETILLAEDDDPLRALLRDALRRHGFVVLEARNGRIAADLLRTHAGPIDVLITDVVMPELGGLELAVQLNAIRPRTPVIYMSGYTNDETELDERTRAGGVFVRKPFRVEAMIEALHRVLRPRSD